MYIYAYYTLLCRYRYYLLCLLLIIIIVIVLIIIAPTCSNTDTNHNVLSTLEILICLLCVGGDIVRQNSITQQILAQYLQKRLNRAGGSVQQIVQPQLLLPTGGNDLTASVVGLNNNGIQRNVAENLYDGRPDDDDDSIEDARYYQG